MVLLGWFYAICLYFLDFAPNMSQDGIRQMLSVKLHSFVLEISLEANH